MESKNFEVNLKTAFEIKPYELKLVWQDTKDATGEWTYVYNAKAQGPDAVVNGTIIGDTNEMQLCTVDEKLTVDEKQTNADTYTRTVKLTANPSTNYKFVDAEGKELTDLSRTYTIEKLKLTVKADDQTITMAIDPENPTDEEKIPELTYTVEPALKDTTGETKDVVFQNALAVKYEGGDGSYYYQAGDNPEFAGDYPIGSYTEGHLKLLSTNYELVKVIEGTLHVKQALLTDVDVEVSGEYVYDGTQKMPQAGDQVTVTYKDGEATKTLDPKYYTVSYGQNINAGTGTVKVDGGINYRFAFTDAEARAGEYHGTFVINQKPVTVAWSKTGPFTYDGKEHMPTATATGFETGDDVRLVLTPPEKDAGKYVAKVTGLAGGQSSNYTLDPSVEDQGFEIEQAKVTITGITAANKVYDGTTAVTLDWTNAVIKREGKYELSKTKIVSATGAFTTADAGDDVRVVISSIALNNPNYTIDPATIDDVKAKITKRPITVSGIKAVDRVYAGKDNKDVELDVKDISFTNVISADIGKVKLAEDAKGTVADGKAGIGKTVSLSEIKLAEDGVSKNYQLDTANSQKATTVNIFKLAVKVTGGIEANEKFYDSTTYAEVKAAASGVTFDPALIGNDDVSVTFTGAFTSKDVDPAGNKVKLTYVDLVGADADNYELNKAQSLQKINGKIKPVELTIKANDKSIKLGDKVPSLDYAITIGNTYESIGTIFAGALVTDAAVDADGKTTKGGEFEISQGDVRIREAMQYNYTLKKFLPGKLIVVAEFGDLTVSVDKTPITYDGKPHQPAVTVKLNDGTVVDPSFYHVIYSANVNAGRATATVIPNDNAKAIFSVPIADTFVISPKAVTLKWYTNKGDEEALAADTPAKYTYDAKQHQPYAKADGLVDGDTCDVTVQGWKIESGEYTAEANYLSNPNYKLPDYPDNQKAFIIQDATLEIELKAEGVTKEWANDDNWVEPKDSEYITKAESPVDGDTVELKLVQPELSFSSIF